MTARTNSAMRIVRHPGLPESSPGEKFRRRPEYTDCPASRRPVLATTPGAVIREEGFLADRLLVPVDLLPERRCRRRGFNTASIIASAAAAMGCVAE